MNAADARRLGEHFSAAMSGNQAVLVAKQTRLWEHKRTGFILDAQESLCSSLRYPANVKDHIRIAMEHLDDALAAALILDPDEPAEQEACPLSGTMAAITRANEEWLDSPGRRP